MGQAPIKEAGDNTAPAAAETAGKEIFQAGGHGGIKKSTDNPGTVLKVGRGTEVEFYQSLNKTGPDAVAIPDPIKAFFPKFYGVQFKFPSNYVVMEDLTHSMAKPCIMDIKMGTQTWEPDSINVIKRYQLETKDVASTTRSLGFRITGMRTYRKDFKDFTVHNKESCLQLSTVDTCEGFLKQFFMDGEKLRADVLNFYIKKMETLLGWFEQQHIVQLIGNSLLFIYDSESMDKKDIRMIDFAHVKRIESDSERDEGYIHGLKTLIKIFRSLRKDLRLRHSKMYNTVD